MTEQQLRQAVADKMTSWVGATKGSAKHAEILKIYNDHRPLARGYKVKVSDAYCATTVSAAFIAVGIAQHTGTECGVEKFVRIAQDKGIWVENDAYVPKLGDAVVYDWQDNGVGDCTGAGDHIGIVTKPGATSFVVTEGNMTGGKTSTRTMAVNGRYIRGFITPKYADIAKALGGASAAKQAAAVGKAAYTVGKTNEETTYNFCREVLGLNVAGAVGVITNIAKESNFQTGALGDGGTSFGICQWHASRYTSLKNWCAANGLDYTTLDGQLWYMKHELETSYSAVLSYIRSVASTADGAYNAAYRWCLKFEIPANTEATSQKRGALARDTYWPKYNGNTSATAAKPTTTSTAGEKKATEAARSLDRTLAGTYAVNATSGLHIRNGAGSKTGSMVVLPCGTKVQCYGYYTLVNGVKWLYVQVTYQGVKYTGFSSGEWLKKQ